MRCGGWLFFILASLLPIAAVAEQQAPQQTGTALPSFTRPAAPPAAREIPHGSASTSPNERRTMAAVRMAEVDAIVLDGRLDEDVWVRAVPATNFVQVEPNNGQPATEQTEVRFVYDADKLYMGVTLFDSEPDKLIYYQMGRDGTLPADDKLQWVIDTFNDGRSAYWWEMNPLGSMADALRGSNNASNRQWDGIWNARSTRTEIGWTLEIEVPFRTMNFNPDSHEWGVNFQRTIARKNEVNIWMGWPRNQGLNRLNNAGQLTGIANVTQGLGLDVKPYVVANSESFPGRGAPGATTDAAAGVDLFYNLTPQLRANFTLNTDFAQAEVDARQVNLTRFSLLFPEKRDFFLDGTLFFDFASFGGGSGGGGTTQGASNDLIPFFSRRIGLDESGAPQRINFGSKLTGQAAGYDIGVIQVQTGEEGNIAGEDFAVMRVKRRMLRESYLGGLYTLRRAREGEIAARQTLGADFRLATSTFLGSENLSASGYFLHTTHPLNVGKQSAFGGEIAYPNDPLLAEIEYTEVQENYDAAVGFTRRSSGYRNFNPLVGFAPRPARHPWIRRFNFAGNLDWFLDARDNRSLTRELDVTAFQVDLHSQDSFQFHVVPTYERLQEDFRIAPGVVLPAGEEFSFTRYRIQGNSSSRRPLELEPEVEWGSFFSGDLRRLALTANFRAAPGQMFTFAHEWNQVSLAEGKFRTLLYRAIAETQFTPRVALVNNVQYDSQSATIGWQSRFRWILKPGTDLYLVYIHNWFDDPLLNRRYTLDRRLSTKALYTHRF